MSSSSRASSDREGPQPREQQLSTPLESEAFTLVFSGDLRKFNGNPHKTDTPFGRPIASTIGNALDNSPDYDRMLSEEACSFVRAAAKRVTAGNCAFIDDDINLLEHLAQRAVDAGLTDRLHPSIQNKIKRGRHPAFRVDVDDGGGTPSTPGAYGEAGSTGTNPESSPTPNPKASHDQ